ncbi:MAG: anti-sigma factor antagonist [Magnetococcales bacterium]|nr:anti-sigma factor antagonist [Magnetococcales bacterium]
MGIDVYENLQTGEAVIELSNTFGSSSRKEFFEAYSSFDPSRNFLLDFNAVNDIDDSCFGMLLLMSKYVRFDAEITITGCYDNLANTLDLSLLNGLFKIR